MESRGVNLEATLTDAEQYQTMHTELISWLESGEEIQRNWSPIGHDLITIRKQYAEHQVCCQQITFLCLIMTYYY